MRSIIEGAGIAGIERNMLNDEELKAVSADLERMRDGDVGDSQAKDILDAFILRIIEDMETNAIIGRLPDTVYIGHEPVWRLELGNPKCGSYAYICLNVIDKSDDDNDNSSPEQIVFGVWADIDDLAYTGYCKMPMTKFNDILEQMANRDTIKAWFGLNGITIGKEGNI